MMHAYENVLRNFGVSVAQLLLTGEDLEVGERRERINDTLQRLLAQDGIVPIINENDSVAVEELSFGDNDQLSARVAQLVGARLLVLLTSVDGLYPPGGGQILDVVENVDEVLDYSDGGKGRFSMNAAVPGADAVSVVIPVWNAAAYLPSTRLQKLARRSWRCAPSG